MPAAVRGAGRRDAGARSKSSSPQGRKPAKPAAATRNAAHLNIAVPPKWIAAGVGAAIVGAAVIAGLVDHRAERFVAGLADDMAVNVADAGFRLDHVSLQGASARSYADILAAAALPAHAPLLTLDLDAARKRIEQVGWVKSATVMRLLPDGVVIAVQERRLLAVWQHNGQASVIDSDGVVASTADPAGFASLPLVVGEGANTAAAAILPAVLSRPRLAERLEALVRVDARRWDLRLKDGCIIQLPATDEEAALIRLDALDQQSRVLDLGLARIDLRDPEMVLVRPRSSAGSGAVLDGAG
ncbi:MAG TPA: cell division protein FtsQ/DivIB [Caulobacteraceae bacterium]|nr:cell division protein FtsQ/DivIB [Caulobacteraceae bacterium]